jgi:ribonuclease VapC
MVLDTSAIIATITNEQDSARFRAAMLGAESLLISSVAVLETRIILFARLGWDAVVPLRRAAGRLCETSSSISTG